MARAGANCEVPEGGARNQERLVLSETAGVEPNGERVCTMMMMMTTVTVKVTVTVTIVTMMRMMTTIMM
eukprot:6309484-Alexandrium_andersonii.AAC.1